MKRVGRILDTDCILTGWDYHQFNTILIIFYSWPRYFLCTKNACYTSLVDCITTCFDISQKICLTKWRSLPRPRLRVIDFDSQTLEDFPSCWLFLRMYWMQLYHTGSKFKITHYKCYAIHHLRNTLDVGHHQQLMQLFLVQYVQLIFHKASDSSNPSHFQLRATVASCLFSSVMFCWPKCQRKKRPEPQMI